MDTLERGTVRLDIINTGAQLIVGVCHCRHRHSCMRVFSMNDSNRMTSASRCIFAVHSASTGQLMAISWRSSSYPKLNGTREVDRLVGRLNRRSVCTRIWMNISCFAFVQVEGGDIR